MKLIWFIDFSKYNVAFLAVNIHFIQPYLLANLIFDIRRPLRLFNDRLVPAFDSSCNISQKQNPKCTQRVKHRNMHNLLIITLRIYNS